VLLNEAKHLFRDILSIENNLSLRLSYLYGKNVYEKDLLLSCSTPTCPRAWE
jgi:hypothetical protein